VIFTSSFTLLHSSLPTGGFGFPVSGTLKSARWSMSLVMLLQGSNTNSKGTTRRYDLVPLAKVDDKHVVDVPGNGEGSSDKNPADDIERKALTVPAPGKSLISASSQVGLLSHFLSCTICWFYCVLLSWQKRKLRSRTARTGSTTWWKLLWPTGSPPRKPSPCWTMLRRTDGGARAINGVG